MVKENWWERWKKKLIQKPHRHNYESSTDDSSRPARLIVVASPTTTSILLVVCRRNVSVPLLAARYLQRIFLPSLTREPNAWCGQSSYRRSYDRSYFFIHPQTHARGFIVVNKVNRLFVSILDLLVTSWIFDRLTSSWVSLKKCTQCWRILRVLARLDQILPVFFNSIKKNNIHDRMLLKKSSTYFSNLELNEWLQKWNKNYCFFFYA